MNPLIEAMTKELARLKKANSNVWHADWDSLFKVEKALKPNQANEFLLEIVPKLEDDGDWYEIFNRLGSRSDSVIAELVDADTLHAFVMDILANTKVSKAILSQITSAPNLSLETIEAIFNYSIPPQALEEDYYNLTVSQHIKECLIKHANATDEFIESLTGERGYDVLHVIASKTKNPEILIKLAHSIARRDSANDDDGGYNEGYAQIVDNDATTVEMLEELALINGDLAGVILESSKCPKALHAKIAQTATGRAARILLSQGKTKHDIMEKLVDGNDDPNVLQGLIQNRSKKIPAHILLKAYAKIPNDNVYLRFQFMKKDALLDAFSEMARKETKCFPRVKEPEEDEVA